MEGIHGNFVFGPGPVAGHLAVQKENRPEDTGVVVGTVGMVRMEDDVAAFVADEVLVERGEEDAPAFLEAPRTGIFGKIELPATPPFRVEPVSQEVYAPPAVADIEPAPPDKILQRGRLAVTEVFTSQKHRIRASSRSMGSGAGNLWAERE